MTNGDIAVMFVAGVILPVVGAVIPGGLFPLFGGRKETMSIRVGSVKGQTALTATGATEPRFIDALKASLGASVISGTRLGIPGGSTCQGRLHSVHPKIVPGVPCCLADSDAHRTVGGCYANRGSLHWHGRVAQAQ